ncbi:alpha/beta hydrolase [Peterkaempfera griseoplana]|uniref:alpha/beta hydrolase n=1 Tax=Peterkaempfera griseoplana TaxID=66896 RepID=UPI0006E42AED|nr:alpha/beta hydrolase [Peterkaempfera griseoplana]
MNGEDRSVLGRLTPGPDLTLRYGPGPDQVADAWPGGARAAQRPLVVLVHGGFWRPDYDRVHLRPLGAALRDAGWTVVSVEYRRRPGHPELTVGDIAMAVAAVPASSGTGWHQGLHNGSTVVVGHSAGGHLALWSAAAAPAPRLAGTLALAPVADLELAYRLDLDGGAVADFLGGPPEDSRDLDPVRLAAPATPVVVLHGVDDGIVPLAVAESYAAAHPAARLVTLPGAGHFALIDPLSEAWEAVLDALASLSD